MLPSNILGILFALTSAIVWGSGDFTGGYATRRSSQYQILAVSALSGLIVLVIAALISRETFPSVRGALWSMLAGASGALGIAAFYRALSIGHNATVAPTAAVIGAIFPVVFNIFTVGFPSTIQMIGFGLAFAGIWLVSTNQSSDVAVPRQAFVLACLAGIGFGGFFISIGQVDQGKIFTPLIIARSLTFCTGIVLIKLNRQIIPALTANPLALLAGVLDAGGNLFYILAKQFTRLDIAAVLASLYPASTVILAAIILKEKITHLQVIGVLVCLGAIGLITI